MQKIYFTLTIGIFVFSFGCKSGTTQSPDNNGSTNGTDSFRIIKNDLSYPWEITWGSDNHIWMTERGGKISRIDPATGSTVFSYNISEVESRGEGGLLGMALHPDFANNGFLYVVYDYLKGADYLEKLVRYRYSNNALSGAVVLLDGIKASGIHNGSRLWITNEANPKIYMTTGDASQRETAQKTNTINGKILRLNIDGSIPADNPFAGSPIWSYGHRNPQGLVMVNNMMYASEHGQDIEDEINIIEKGRNYGWSDVEGPCTGGEASFCTSNNVKEPLWSSGSSTLAACGLDYYNNNRLSKWNNSLLLVTLKNSSLRQLQLSGDGKSVVSANTWFLNKWGRLRDVCVSPDGKVYICTSNGSNDQLIEISKL